MQKGDSLQKTKPQKKGKAGEGFKIFSTLQCND